MPLAGLVLNRVHRPAVQHPDAERPASRRPTGWRRSAGTRAPWTTLRAHAALLRQAAREQRVAAPFTEAFPQVPTVAVTAQPADVHDVDGLRTIGAARRRDSAGR